LQNSCSEYEPDDFEDDNDSEEFSDENINDDEDSGNDIGNNIGAEDQEEDLSWEELEQRAAEQDRRARLKERNNEFVQTRAPRYNTKKQRIR